MHTDPELWAALLDRLADLALACLRAQVAAGASAVQLFDSWAGALTPADYERFVLPASAKVLAGVADLGVPRIHFGVATGELLGLMRQAGADVVGVDWRVPLDDRPHAASAPTVALQGNLDPALVVAGWGRHRGRRPRRAAAQRRPPRAHLQPGPRRAARDRPRACWSGWWRWSTRRAGPTASRRCSTPGPRHEHGRTRPSAWW